jgi:hypothetical protein
MAMDFDGEADDALAERPPEKPGSYLLVCHLRGLRVSFLLYRRKSKERK